MGNKLYGMCSGETARNEVKHEWEVSQIQDDTNTQQQGDEFVQKLSKSKAVNKPEFNDEDMTQMKEFDSSYAFSLPIVNRSLLDSSKLKIISL